MEWKKGKGVREMEGEKEERKNELFLSKRLYAVKNSVVKRFFTTEFFTACPLFVFINQLII